jgi:DNA-directed RNA polymerase subunit beta'
MPKILDYATFCENLDEVTSLKTFGKRKFHSEGLFSEQIFGPVRNYTCQCGKYHGVSKVGGQCKECGVDIVNSDERRKRFAKITIPIKVVNPLFYDLLVDLAGKTFKKAIDDLMRNDKSVLYMTDEEFVVTMNEETVPIDAQRWERTDAIMQLVQTYAEDAIENDVKEWQLIMDNIDNLLIDQIIVLPPDLRPTSKSSGESKQLMDKINRYYVQILTKKEIMKDTIIDIHRDKALYYTYFKQLQKDVNELYTRILEKMAKKEGLIRGNILGKRIDFSGRAVITPDPTLALDECKLPYLMILEIFKLPIAKRIIELGKFKLLNKAIDFVDECIDKDNPVLYRVCETVIANEYCVLNRQPSLHKLGMLAFKIKITTDHVIKIHPLVCPPFNADFDGDQMAVYIPITTEAKAEVIAKISIVNNLSSPANETLTTTPSQDVILGIYYLTSPIFNDTKEKVTFKEKEITWGEAEFNHQLPEDYPLVTGIIAKGRLMTILNDIKDKYPPQQVIQVLDNVKKIGFKYATLYGCTMSLDDFSLDRAQEIRDEVFSKGDLREQLTSLSDDKMINELKDHFKYAYMIESGARGTWDQVKQLILSRGFISNFNGEILPTPIKHSLIEGLTPEEFFFSTYGCRKGLLDVALNTGTSGYLSRKLIFTCANLQIDDQLDDCGTNDFLQVDVNSERKARMLVNKYYKKDNSLELITKDNFRQLVGKLIEVRSPILCQSPKICKTCYGDLYKSLNSRFIGIIAAQTLGERGTQLVLRTFHTSGSAVIKGEQDNTEDPTVRQKDIIGDLSSVADLLHKFRGKTYTDIVHDLFAVYDKDIYHVHFECVVAQLMWKKYRKWRLMDGRSRVEPDYYSIQSVPNQESWILAMAFSNPKRSILHGILYEGRYSGVMDKILKGEKIT